MSSMVLTQLLNPESGIDRKATGKLPDTQGAADQGPSRYDEVVRQQEKRLEQRRVEDRARERAMERERQAEARHDDRAEETRPDPSARVEKAERRSDTASAARRGRSDEDEASRKTDAQEGAGKGTDPVAESRSVNGKPAEEAVTEGQKLSPEELAGELLDLADASGTPSALPFNGSQLQGVPATGLMAPGLVAGQQRGASATVGRLFAAMLETGKESGGKGGDLLAGLQGNNTQLLSESSGKVADSLMTRLSAPELTQSLNQSATLRGQEAQALMRSYSTSVDAPVGENEWGEKVMGKLAWLTASQMSVAEIHITPPELGPLDVRVQVQNDQATVTVHASTPAVREQLELHGHRLRDMLSEQGLSLEGFDVSDSPGRETAGQQGDGDGQGERGPGQRVSSAEEGDTGTVTSGALDLSWRGEVDLYA
ncbi:flagellar hook-length control protein FliK [Marinobacter sp. AN1]|uniref:flagellar hook-length control protein FliK n=1 Tax=Marinobacter sp. AN1 TaxID=2886046 RepID=UPI00222E6E46|nr:flagellar hook-length control protein FliK [Marinobacter sp. AN1]UZD64525.1 flagellar hook-length control protein FliK [Marinobacter sp. AN1]